MFGYRRTFMLRLGPNGIPLSCKGRTWLDALQDVRNLELEAIEFQLLRVPLDEEIEDILRGRRPAVENGEDIRKRAEELDIFIGTHAPYYMDLLGGEEDVQRSFKYLKWSGHVAHEIGAQLVVTHVGYYNDLSPKEAIDRAVVMLRKIRDYYRRRKFDLYLGIEVHGKQDLFGGFEEVLAVTKRISGTMPVVNFAHMHARGRGHFKRKEDFDGVLETLFRLGLPYVYTLFSGLEHDFEGNELRFTPIKKGDMRFQPLAESLLDHADREIIVISSSPLLEHDAQYMKVLIRRVEEKRFQKANRIKAGSVEGAAASREDRKVPVPKKDPGKKSGTKSSGSKKDADAGKGSDAKRSGKSGTKKA
ncbi:MAG TPA: hypothetical protein EYP43_02150, partial [Thermoplasmata archaeon]|nr:hypothetical protein [Thermoplasmata archaeon]